MYLIIILTSRFLLEFFVTEEPRGKSGVMRPLTNSNFVCDFYRYRASEYYGVVTRYLKSRGQLPPSDYELQYDKGVWPPTRFLFSVSFL